MKVDIDKLSLAERAELLKNLEEKLATDNKLYNEALDKVLAIVNGTGVNLEYFIKDLQDRGSKKKRVSSPSPRVVNPNNPRQSRKIKGKQPEWRTAIKQRSDYSLWNHVKDSLQHLDEEGRRINNEWLNKNQPEDLGEGPEN